MSILDKIVTHKKIEIPYLKRKYGHAFKHGEKRSFIKRIENNRYISCIAEIKRGSPSKGPFALDLDILDQATFYEKNNVDCISVLVDEKFFYGSYDFIPAIRSSVKVPILFKEFIIDSYQIDLASHLGADIVLLIERILTPKVLNELINHAHHLGLEVLVEVDSTEAIERIKDFDFKLLGINNRDLSDFTINLEKTNQLKDLATTYGKYVVSESGLQNRSDLLKIRGNISAILIGEALVRSKKKIEELKVLKAQIQVKICGIQDKKTLQAIDGICDYIGLVFAKSRRQVSVETALELKKYIHHSKLVGVFKDQSLEDILRTKCLVDLDIVQIHDGLSLPFDTHEIIRAKKYTNLAKDDKGMILVDNIIPGSGDIFPLDHLHLSQDADYILAGGLTPDNIESRVNNFPCYCVDVSSGVESNGIKDIDKIQQFIEKVRAL